MQNLTQRDLAKLLGTTKGRIEALIGDKDRYIVRRAQRIGSKDRMLALPVGKLRTVHERLKFHLNKIKQPEYLYSPRKGRGQRDNAEHHAGQNQILGLDIKQFYPSTTQEHIFRWAYHVAGLRSDVAGMLAKLVAIDGKMPFGSPVSPVLTTLVHRAMFDEIYELCKSRGLKTSLWVDDLVISGLFVCGELLNQVREVIRRHGFQTHKITFRSSARPVHITGVPVEKSRVLAPRSLHQRIQDGYALLRSSENDAERSAAIDRLLSALGTHRYHLGAGTFEGRLSANRMQALRRRRADLRPKVVTQPQIFVEPAASPSRKAGGDLPWSGT